MNNNIIKSQNDTREYKRLLLDNELEVILISDPITPICAAALSVNIGYYHDPEDYDGLAHFLEHMLFMGTTKYPNESYFMNYLSTHGGSTNAYTTEEVTNFHFSIYKDHFNKSLDIFSQFFTSPLFSESSVLREINAVNSEHLKNVNNEHWRINRVIKNISDNKDPYDKFGTGNFETLQKPNVRDVLIEFYNKYYSSNIMKLVIYDNKSIEDSEKYVTELFSLVKNKNVVLKNFDYQFNINDNKHQECNKLIKIVPLSNINQLYIFWQLPNQDKHFMYNPSSYIANLIGHEGDHSLNDILIKYNFINYLQSGIYDGNKSGELFMISIDLTQNGYENIDIIIHLIYKYIDLVKNKGVESWIYDEQRKIGKMNFKYAEKSDVMSYVTNVCSSLFTIPYQYILSNKWYGDKYDDTAQTTIKDVFNYIKKSNSIIVSVSKSYENIADITDKYYGVKYCVSDNLNEFKYAKKTGIDKEFRLPVKNIFIPDKIEILKSTIPINSIAIPKRLDKKGDIELWYCKDINFNTPYVIVLLCINTPSISSTIINNLSMNLYIKLFDLHIQSYKYYADQANCDFEVSYTMENLYVEIKCYPNTIFQICEKIVNTFFNFEISNDKFIMFKNETKKNLINFKLAEPYVIADNLFKEKSYVRYYSTNQKINHIDKITIENLMDLKNSLRKGSNVKILVEGNITSDNAVKIKNTFNDFSANESTKITEWVSNSFIHELKHSEEETYMRKIEDDTNQVIHIFYEVGNIKKKCHF